MRWASRFLKWRNASDRERKSRTKLGCCVNIGIDRELTFMGGFVSQHRLAGDVADGKDVGDIGAALVIHLHEATLIERDTCRFQAGSP